MKGLSKLLNLTLESLLQPNPSSKESSLDSRREGRNGVNAQMSVCLVVGQQQMREIKWGIYTSPQNLAVTVQK
jgi:hypothetical protein